jgi:hydrogenase maturation protein HypF
MAEHGIEHALAVVFDGTGLGTDGHVWGAELLEVRRDGYERLGTFAGVPLPGGDAAVREPVRQLVGRWVDAGVEVTEARCRAVGVSPQTVAVWVKQCERGLNAPIAHSAGRLLDSFAALLGVAPTHTTYEGQTAIRLEGIARRCSGVATPVDFRANEQDGLLVVDWSEAFRRLSASPVDADAVAGIALGAHHALAAAAVRMVNYAFARSDCRVVVLSGGVMMNRILTERLVAGLTGLGARVLTHGVIPPNDGGIAVGQAVLAGRCEGTEPCV